MSPELWNKVSQAWEEYYGLPADERAGFLERVRGQDAELAAELETLLRQRGDSEQFDLSAPPDDVLNQAAQSGEEPNTAAYSGDDESPPTSHSFSDKIGRYRVLKLLGKGAFGRVFLAHDDELERHVAIKVPHPERIKRPDDVEQYLAEARTLARLDHPHIVPVHDVGRTGDGLYYVVSKYIEGRDLASQLKNGRLSFPQAAELVATAAEALHYAHKQGFVHRDIKPGNILLDAHGKPYVADFGLALTEEDFGKHAQTAGTPAYMSPEQARGEAHLVDGRADIFSLGVVFYELLAGRRPFRGDTFTEILQQISSVEAKPPRQIDDAIPKELERICMKALAKQPADRYTTALDMSEDLRGWLAAYEPSTAGDTPTFTKSSGLPPTTASVPDTVTANLPKAPRGHRRWTVAVTASALLLIAAGLAALFFWNPEAKIDGDIDVRVWKKEKSRSGHGMLLHQKGVLPLQAGDWVQVNVRLTTGPAYLYVVWLEASGNVLPMYPWKNQHWNERPPDEEPIDQWVTRRSPLTPGPSGVEGMLLMVRPTKLPADADTRLQAAFHVWRKQTKPSDPDVRAWLENGRIVQDEANRAAPKRPRLQDDPIMQLQQLTKGPLAQWFPYTRAVCYAFKGK